MHLNFFSSPFLIISLKLKKVPGSDSIALGKELVKSNLGTSDERSVKYLVCESDLTLFNGA